MVQQLAQLVQGLREDGVGGVEVAAHTGHLAALAGEEATLAGRRRAPDQPRRGRARRQRGQAGLQFAEVAAEQDGAVREGGPGERQ